MAVRCNKSGSLSDSNGCSMQQVGQLVDKMTLSVKDFDHPVTPKQPGEQITLSRKSPRRARHPVLPTHLGK